MLNLKYSEIFREAKVIINIGWTHAAYARDCQGQPVSQCAPEATSWCLNGAVGRAEGKQEAGPSREVGLFMRSILLDMHIPYTTDIESFNDFVANDSTEIIGFLDICERKALANGN